ncbi:PE-PGRS family protein [Mycobacterium intracellulare]|uniref:PE-PGRS family protein n=1 Tax=Mycobacterium intracellulare TaxID=1767 RepID=UPI000BAC222A|nr:PE-PGRS family protein [Mycobacterium intracellulare]ASX03444.1 PE-PGRS family protein [Mycobacterium intracellulare subsp. chimaera]PBA61228.1 PE-PGRS family protein [Mycobacterium intracellulare subsp. chimaera]
MLANLTLTKPLMVIGALSALIAIAPALQVSHPLASGTPTTAHAVTFKQDPGGGGCDGNGNCGWGGQNDGPGGGLGGHGCLAGVGCGSGGQFTGPGGVPGATGCLPGVGCGSGHA